MKLCMNDFGKLCKLFQVDLSRKGKLKLSKINKRGGCILPSDRVCVDPRSQNLTSDGIYQIVGQKSQQILILAPTLPFSPGSIVNPMGRQHGELGLYEKFHIDFRIDPSFQQSGSLCSDASWPNNEHASFIHLPRIAGRANSVKPRYYWLRISD
jgi:hypothetical protein